MYLKYDNLADAPQIHSERGERINLRLFNGALVHQWGLQDQVRLNGLVACSREVGSDCRKVGGHVLILWLMIGNVGYEGSRSMTVDIVRGSHPPSG